MAATAAKTELERTALLDSESAKSPSRRSSSAGDASLNLRVTGGIGYAYHIQNHMNHACYMIIHAYHLILHIT